MSASPVPYPFRWFPGLAAFFALLCLPLIFSTNESNYTWDEIQYHAPAVRQIREHWPRLDLLRDSLSATAPGYHYALATLSFVTGTQTLNLRLVNFAVSLGVLALLWRAWPSDLAPRTVLLALLPLAASNFFVKSASFLVTDNAALLATTGTLSALFFTRTGIAPARASLCATAAVLIRQSGAWLVAPLGFAILRSGLPASRLLWTLLPVAALGWLVATWGGLVPPIWHQAHYASSGLVPAAGAYMLAVLALLGTVYYAALRPAGWRQDLVNPLTGLGAAAGLVVALIGPNDANYDAGRWGGYLWEVAARVPAAGSFSPVFLLLAPAGGAMLALLTRRLWQEAGGTTALSWLATYVAWWAAGLSNRQVFHRYFEPFTLVLLICWLLLIIRARPTASPVVAWPLVVLGTFQIAVTLVTAYGRTFGLL